MEISPRQLLEPRQRLTIFSSFATMFMVGVAISLLGPSLPGLAERTGRPLSQAGIFFTLFSGGSVLATLVVARLMDRPVRHAFLIGGAFIMGGAQWLVAGGGTFAVAAAAFALTGLALSTTGTAPNAIIADLYRERAGQALNALHLCLGVGAFIGPLLVGAAIRFGANYAVAYRVAGSFMFLVGLLWLVSRPPLPRRSAGPQPRTPLSATIALPMIVLLCVAMLYTGTEQAFGGWIFTYARDAIRIDVSGASLVTSSFWLAIMLGRLIAMRVLPRFGDVGLLIACVLVAALGIGGALVSSRVPPLLWGGVALVGLGFGPIFPTVLAVGTGRFPAYAGMISSLTVAAGSVGAMALPWASGALIPRLGLVGSIASSFVPLALMLSCLWVISRLNHRAQA
ncbi:MAG: hypothetical protein AUK03_01105 [Anaerolineae bacterium CG2_30_64_16]|nr:MAG: hypothetical protein AUK03_01105 [Anaerolineae bacterium CG2_30_64_16]